MTNRDNDIINDLFRFRCMSRNDIAEIHFPNLKDPIKSANAVLKRLVRDGLITCSRQYLPYLYFPIDNSIKKDSAKIPHYLEIVKVYKEMKQIHKPIYFVVEPKYGKGFIEPDIFCIWKGAPLWIEVQRTMIGDKAIQDKIERYEAYYDSRKWVNEVWQPTNKVFPPVVFVSPHRFHLESDRVHFKQVDHIGMLLDLSQPKQEGGIRAVL